MSLPQTTSGFPIQYHQGLQQNQLHQQHGIANVVSPYKSFPDAAGGQPPPQPHMNLDKPQIYTAVYSGVNVYEFEVKGVACMRRRADGWLNATQILKVAGVEKGKRTKVLEKEVLAGEHEKVQGGYGKYQGTWISYVRGREFCRQYGVEELLLPLLEYDMPGDGSIQQPKDTPTKEQAMALNRKRFYNTNANTDNRKSHTTNGGTFFSNISPMTSVALNAMNKAAQGNPNNSMLMRQSFNHNQVAHQSMPNDNSFFGDSTTDPSFALHAEMPTNDTERPRKRMRPSENLSMSRMSLPVDVSMQSITPTDASFSQMPDIVDAPFDPENPLMLPPLPKDDSDPAEEKRLLLMDLFTDTTRSDYSDHPAIIELHSSDLDMPLDVSANTALHWAATLARVPLLRLLIGKGANIWRGNAAGQSALVSCVLVNNCWERSCFPDMLELLGPLIEVKDATGRTLLHHIAVACGIKGRSPSSKYYLEALLEFLIRSAGQSSAHDLTKDTGRESRRPPSLMRFLSNVVNSRDRRGNTALNLVARIGNRSIIQQLLEIKADPSIPNNKGVSAYDFGISASGINVPNENTRNGAPEKQRQTNPDSASGQQPDLITTTDHSVLDQIESQNSDVISALTSMLTQNLTQHKALLATKSLDVDRLNAQIHELSTKQQTQLERFKALQRASEQRQHKRKQIENLRYIVEERNMLNGFAKNALRHVGSADQIDFVTLKTQNIESSRLQPVNILRKWLKIYACNNVSLTQLSQDLQSKSHDLEMQYRRVVALCTGVKEDMIEGVLGNLVAAVESERGGVAATKPTMSQLRRTFGAAAENKGGDVSMLDMSMAGPDASMMSAPGHNAADRMQLNNDSAMLGPTGGSMSGTHAQLISQDNNGQMMNNVNAAFHPGVQPAMDESAHVNGFEGALYTSGAPTLNVGRVRDFLAMVEGVHGTALPGVGANDLLAGHAASGAGGANGAANTGIVC